jgi:hypothetical protein
LLQKAQDLGGLGRQDSSGPHTINLMHASTTQLLAMTRAQGLADKPGAAAARNALADLTSASSSANGTPGVLAEAHAVAADLELVITPPHTAGAQAGRHEVPQSGICTPNTAPVISDQSTSPILIVRRCTSLLRINAILAAGRRED